VRSAGGWTTRRRGQRILTVELIPALEFW
jgi:hypothetical protein